MEPLLAIVPARAGSAGLVGKNMRLVKGLPLIGHTLFALREAAPESRIVLSTDAREAAAWAGVHGFETLARPAALAGAETRIAEVAQHAAEALDWDGVVGVFQPTSPLRGPEVVSAMLREFARSGATSLSTVFREPHLYWRECEGGAPEPLFTERVNRQYGQHEILRETGAAQLVRAAHLRATGEVVSADHQLFETDFRASIDIDSFNDLSAVRALAEEGDVVFRIRGEIAVGSGHLVHCLQLAEELSDQRLHFLVHGRAGDFVEKALGDRGYSWRYESDLRKDLQGLAREGHPRVLVNDILDTAVEDVLVPKALGFIVVNIEDLGEGARYADWVVNALYAPNHDDPGHISSGARWATLRHEFHGLPQRRIAETAQRILVTFGGTDPANLASRFSRVLAGLDLDLEIRVIVGPGAEAVEMPAGISVATDITSMAAEMVGADLVVTSAGRTVYEAALCGTPVVALAQNAREAAHAHLGAETGVVFLGIGSLVDDGTVARIVERMLADCQLRRELSARLQASIDVKGAERIGNTIRGLMRGLLRSE